MSVSTCHRCGESLANAQQMVCPHCGEEQPTQIFASPPSTGNAPVNAPVNAEEAATLIGSVSETDAQAMSTQLPDTARPAGPGASPIFAKPDSGDGFGSYYHTRVIGNWRFGEILAASHPHLEREAVLFVARQPWVNQAWFREWFMETSRKLAAVSHPAVAVTVLEAVKTGTSIFVALSKREVSPLSELMEEVRGKLFEIEGDPLSLSFSSLLSGLEAFHRAGLFHGAISAHNVGRLGTELRPVLLPCQESFPAETLVDEQGLPTADASSLQQQDYRMLATAFLLGLSQRESDAKSSWPKRMTTEEVRRRLPLLNPGLSRILTNLSSGTVTVDRIPALQSQLDVCGRQSLRPASWSDRLGTLLYDLAIFTGGGFALVLLTALVSSNLGDAAAPLILSSLGLWTFGFLVVSEPFLGATPGRRMRGLFLANREGGRPSRSVLFARSLTRLVTWAVATIVCLGVLQWLASSLFWVFPPFASFEYFLIAVFPSSLVAILALYCTAFFLRGKPIHDWVTAIRLVRYITLESAAINDSEAELRGRAAFAELQSDHRHGTSVDQYRVGAELGRGGMGAVYHSWDTVLGREAALKVITLNSVDATDALPRFEREAKLVAMLDHVNIANVYGVGTWDAQPYMAMEYVAGRTLRQLVDETGPLSVANAWDLTTQAARGLGHAAARGIVHRDVKPSNLMITPDSIVKVMDFGISKGLSEEPLQPHGGEGSAARSPASQLPNLVETGDASLTRTGSVMGTPQFMSPEQAKAEPLDARSDIYSLGLTLYFLLAGKPPFESTEFYDLLVKQCSDPPPPLPPHLLSVAQQQVLDRMLAKDPQDRYQGFEELTAALSASAPLPLRLANGSSRVAATIIDSIAATCLQIVLEIVLIAALPGLQRWMILTAMVITYSGLLLTLRFGGWTPGKWLLKLRVRPLQGKRLTWRHALPRFLTKWPQLPILAVMLGSVSLISPQTTAVVNLVLLVAILILYATNLGFLLCRVDRRTIHDLVAGTIVVQLPHFREKI